jgi:hypothetical protein
MKLSKHLKSTLVTKTLDLIYQTSLAETDSELTRIGDQIYELIIDTYDLQEIKKFPKWFTSVVSKCSIKYNERYIEVKFSDYKPWGNNIRIAYFSPMETPKLYTASIELYLERYIENEKRYELILEEKNNLKKELNQTLKSINTTNQLKDKLPKLFEIYQKYYAEVPITNSTLPAIDYNKLNNLITNELNNV